MNSSIFDLDYLENCWNSAVASASNLSYSTRYPLNAGHSPNWNNDRSFSSQNIITIQSTSSAEPGTLSFLSFYILHTLFCLKNNKKYSLPRFLCFFELFYITLHTDYPITALYILCKYALAKWLLVPFR